MRGNFPCLKELSAIVSTGEAMNADKRHGHLGPAAVLDCNLSVAVKSRRVRPCRLYSLFSKEWEGEGVVDACAHLGLVGHRFRHVLEVIIDVGGVEEEHVPVRRRIVRVGQRLAS